MGEITRTEELEPEALSPERLEWLTGALYETHSEIFGGVTQEDFARYVVHSPAEKTSIKVFYGEGEEVAGYVAIHFFSRQFSGEPCTVVRAEAGLKRAYRGNNAVGSFLAGQVLSGWLSRSGPMYYLGSLVHPSSYCAFARYAPTIWPQPGESTPADVLGFMSELADEFGLVAADQGRPLVRKVGWITRDTPAERRYWEACERPLARFFIEQNPEYTEGDGLVTLVPLSAGNLALGLFNWGSTRLQRSMGRLTTAVMEAVWSTGLGEAEIERLLQRAAPLNGLPPEIIHELAESGIRQTLSSGEKLFYEGDAADALYLVLSGAVFVLRREENGEEVIFDQLGPGSMIGEIALVLSTTRMASARAATTLSLLKLDHHALQVVRDAHPEVEETIWNNIGLRLLATRSRAHPRLHALTLEQLQAWYRAGTQHSLHSGASVIGSRGEWVLVIDGEVDVDGAEDQALLHEMSFMRLHGDATIYAPFRVRIAILPPRNL